MESALNQVPVPAVRSAQDRLFLTGSILAIGTLCYFVGLVIYRLSFHPLARFPGPLINRISDVRPETHDTPHRFADAARFPA